MNWKRKTLWLAALAAALVCTGCGGFSGSHSVSPASFFLPGLGQTLPPPPEAQPQAPDFLPTPTSPAPGPLAQAR